MILMQCLLPWDRIKRAVEGSSLVVTSRDVEGNSSCSSSFLLWLLRSSVLTELQRHELFEYCPIPFNIANLTNLDEASNGQHVDGLLEPW